MGRILMLSGWAVVIGVLVLHMWLVIWWVGFSLLFLIEQA